jgi:hypothetical protein
VSLNEIKKQFQIAGKGDTETLEIANPMEHTTVATDDTSGHVPENGGTCVIHILRSSSHNMPQLLQASGNNISHFFIGLTISIAQYESPVCR